MRKRSKTIPRLLTAAVLRVVVLACLAAIPMASVASAASQQGNGNGHQQGNGNGNGNGGNGNGNGTPTPPPGNNSEIDPGNLPKVGAGDGTINKVKNIIFGILGAFALLSITLSGLKYITSSGDPQKTSEAKNGIVYSLLGLALAITADAIITFVVNRAS
jgi:hypothetical protein